MSTDANNSSTSALAAGATFTGTTTDLPTDFPDAETILVSIKMDGAAGCTLFMEGSSDSSNWDVSDEYAVVSGVHRTIRWYPHAQFYRVRVVNGTGAMSYMRLQARVFTHPDGSAANTAVATGGALAIRALNVDASGSAVYGGACRLHSCLISNSDVAGIHFKIYNVTSVTVGTDTPEVTVYIPATSTVAWSPPFGLSLSTGLCVAATSLAADADTTPIVASTVHFSATYSA